MKKRKLCIHFDDTSKKKKKKNAGEAVFKGDSSRRISSVGMVWFCTQFYAMLKDVVAAHSGFRECSERATENEEKTIDIEDLDMSMSVNMLRLKNEVRILDEALDHVLLVRSFL